MPQITILRQGDINALHDDRLEVNWTLTEMCNYCCSYCFEQNNDKKKIDQSRFSTFSQLKNAIDNLYSLNRSSYSIVLSGGEPTIHPHFSDFLNYAHEKIGEKLAGLKIITNGSKLSTISRGIEKTIKYVPVGLIISIHTDHLSIGKIREIIKTYSSLTSVSLSLMFNPQKREYVKEIFDELLSLRDNFPFWLRIATLRQPPKFDIPDTRYTKEDYLWQDAATMAFQDRAKQSRVSPIPYKTKFGNITTFWDVIEDGQYSYKKNLQRDIAFKTGLFGFKNMYCAMATNMLSISSKGFCNGARCSIAPLSTHSIFEKNPYDTPDFVQSIKCSLANCGCGANDQILKFANKDEADDYINLFVKRQQTKLNSLQ